MPKTQQAFLWTSALEVDQGTESPSYLQSTFTPSPPTHFQVQVLQYSHQ